MSVKTIAVTVHCPKCGQAETVWTELEQVTYVPPIPAVLSTPPRSGRLRVQFAEATTTHDCPDPTRDQVTA